MSCGLFDILLVSDDPADRERAREHARGCERCAAILLGHETLARETESWRSDVDLPVGLEAEVLSGIDRAATDAPVVSLEDRRRTAKRSTSLPLALAAMLVLGVGIGILVARLQPRGPETADRLLVEEALEAADTAEELHARAIARLERAADPVLARAADPHTVPREAAILLAYRDRLAFLDATIAEVHDFIDTNPGNAGARTVLLAAYVEKTEILREVVALEVIS